MVAYRRALELLRADRRLTPLETLPERRAGTVESEGALEYRAALDAIAASALSRRDARLLGLSAAGCSYAEMLAMSEETPRSLQRRLDRARRRIWSARGEERPSRVRPVARAAGRPIWRSVEVVVIDGLHHHHARPRRDPPGSVFFGP